MTLLKGGAERRGRAQPQGARGRAWNGARARLEAEYTGREMSTVCDAGGAQIPDSTI